MRVAAVRDVGPDAVAIELETPPGFDGRAGQFVRLTDAVDGEEYSRFYTLSSADVEEIFEVTVEAGPEAGPFAHHLTALSAGDDLALTGPFGDQYYEGADRVVVLAGGPGVGPAVAIAAAALEAGNEAAVVYRDENPIHAERIADLRERGADVVVTDGDLTDHVADALAGDGDMQVFVYGFQPFVDDAIEAVVAAGGDAEAAKVESFG